jgi:DNA polymerase-3 subunit epsilon
LLARRKHPGQKNNLDALCKRYSIDNSNRSLHGALLDARILADVYLAMTGGQTSLGLDAEQGEGSNHEQIEVQRLESGLQLPLWQAEPASQQANQDYIDFLASQHDDPAWK